MATWYVNKSGFNATRVFTVSGLTITPTTGATYTNNSITYTVVGATVSGSAGSISGYLFCTGSNVPTASGTLTKASGIGDATVSFSAYQAGGSSATAAYLTIQGGLNLMSVNGDTLIVGSGTYAERLTTPSFASSSNSYLYADGVVVLDGASLSGTGNTLLIRFAFSSTSNSFNMSAHPNGGAWIIQNYNVSSISSGLITNASDNNNTSTQINISNVTLYGNLNSAIGMSNVYGTPNWYVANCVFSGFSNYGFYNNPSFNTGPDIIQFNTFYNCTYGIYNSVSAAGTCLHRYNIFHTCTSGTKTASNPGAYLERNCYYNCTNLLTVGSTNYTTLASVQAINSELNGSSSNPNLIDPANGVFFLSASGNYGAYPYSAMTRGASYNPDSSWVISATPNTNAWYCSDGNITKNGTTGFFELTSGTSGVIWSPVYDIGSIQFVTQLNLASIQTWSTSMIDTNKTDSRPNYQTAEVRASVNSFNQDAASPDWTEVKSNCPFTAMSGRYVQVRLTFRSDDVGA
ncbi:MAG: hypothetical protein WC746_05380 [archaeon]|jgi:hypothetical protein